VNYHIPQIAYAVFCVFFAFVNYWQIEKVNDHVRHGINGTFHAITSLYFGIFVHWALGLSILFGARLTFDITLNLLRIGVFGIFYVPKNPKSIVDKIEKFVFKNNAVVPKAIYAIIITVLNTLLIKNII
jgi:hypothetical protein